MHREMPSLALVDDLQIGQLERSVLIRHIPWSLLSVGSRIAKDGQNAAGPSECNRTQTISVEHRPLSLAKGVANCNWVS